MCTLYNVLKTFFLICKCMLFLMYLYHYHFGLCCINNVFAWDGWMCVHVCVVCVFVWVYTQVCEVWTCVEANGQHHGSQSFTTSLSH